MKIIREVTIGCKRKRRRGPRKKVILADEATIADVLGQRPEPEFKNCEYVPSGISDGQLNIFRCDEPNCGASFTNSISLIKHKNHHLDRAIKCEWCGQTFKTTQDLQDHQEEFHFGRSKDSGANLLQCRKCLKICRDKKALSRHIQRVHREKKQICPKCRMQFTQPYSLTEHVRKVHALESEKQTFPCPMCPAKYGYLGCWRLHIRDKHRGAASKTFNCVICKTVYTQLHCYRNHMRLHTTPTHFPCQICNVKFRNRSHLSQHKSSIKHKSAERKAKKQGLKIDKPCESESSKESAPKNLSVQELIHLCKVKVVKIVLRRVDEHVIKAPSKVKLNAKRTEKNKAPGKKLAEKNEYYLKCLYCEANFSTLDDVKAHEVRCSKKIVNLKLHICPICDKEYTHKFKLDGHLKTHSTERPFKCAYCEKVFKQESTKVRHEKAIHFGIRPKPVSARIVTCNYEGCGKLFKGGIKNLRRHVATIHRGIRYPCKGCGKLFRREDAMRNHYIKEHTNIPTEFFCGPCNKKYKSKELFRIHLGKPIHARRVAEAASAAQKSVTIRKV